MAMIDGGEASVEPGGYRDDQPPAVIRINRQ
jgi:hypothetical protein